MKLNRRYVSITKLTAWTKNLCCVVGIVYIIRIVNANVIQFNERSTISDLELSLYQRHDEPKGIKAPPLILGQDIPEHRAAMVGKTEHRAAMIEKSEHRAAMVEKSEHRAAMVEKSDHRAAMVEKSDHRAAMVEKSEHRAAMVEKSEHRAAMVDSSGNATVMKVIVIAYYRGGSSFLAQLLNHHSEAMYLFEPLTAEFSRYKDKQKILGSGDVYVYPKTGELRLLTPEMNEWVIHASIKLLNCEYDELPDATFFHDFIMSPSFTFGGHIKKYRGCMNFERSENMTSYQFKVKRRKHYKDKWPECKGKLLKVCNKRKFRAFKTIRMTLEHAYEVIKADSNVKVVYSTRDPRGMASSRHKIDLDYKNMVTPPSFWQRAKELCVRVENDLKFLPKLVRDFPENVFSTRFETMVADPMAIAKEFYQFLGVEMPDGVFNWAQKQVEKHGNNPHGNVTEKWKKALTSEQMQILDDECSDLITKIGVN